MKLQKVSLTRLTTTNRFFHFFPSLHGLLTISSSVSKVILKISPCSVWAKKKNIDLVLWVAEQTKIIPLSGSSRSFQQSQIHNQHLGNEYSFSGIQHFTDKDHTGHPRPRGIWSLSMQALTQSSLPVTGLKRNNQKFQSTINT